MGLDAAVYADDAQDRQVSSLRIGNSSLVAFLRNEISGLGCDAPVLQEKVLYSGTHAGDELSLTEVESLRRELRAAPPGSPELEQFRGDLLALCEIAVCHGRPIVF